MRLGTVVARVWSDRQIASLDGKPMLLVQDNSDTSVCHVAIDLVGAGRGDAVLVVTETAAAAAAAAPEVDAAVVAIVTRDRAESSPLPEAMPERTAKQTSGRRR